MAARMQEMPMPRALVFKQKVKLVFSSTVLSSTVDDGSRARGWQGDSCDIVHPRGDEVLDSRAMKGGQPFSNAQD